MRTEPTSTARIMTFTTRGASSWATCVAWCLTLRRKEMQAERVWQQQAEDNVIERLTGAGLLAPEGDVDRILQTVVNNLEVTNNIDLPRPVRTRVLLTAPLETFSVGNTIVISRGLVDVLPDEASLAAVLSHELAHIVLGHNLGSKFAFNDRM